MRFAANEFAMYVLRRTYWRLGRNCDENRENNFGQVLRQRGAVSGGSVFSADVDGMGDMRQYGGGRRLLTGAPDRDFYGGVCGGVLGQAWLNARLAKAEERRSYQRLVLFLWLYLALCGTGLAVKILV